MKGILPAMILLLLALGCEKSEQKPVFWGFALDGFPITIEKIEALKEEAGVDPKMIVFYLQWPSEGGGAPGIVSSLEVIDSIQATPSMTWEPMVITGEGEMAIPFQDIVGGKYDPYIKAVAQQVKAWGGRMVIRFAQEMNLSRYHWGTEALKYGPESPEIYKKMFGHVVDVFRAEHVENVLWAFCPNAESEPKAPWNVAKNYYPGDKYVDILGMDGYNWDITPEIAAARKSKWVVPWRSFKEIFSALYDELKAVAPRKPMIVFETATVDRNGDGQRRKWIEGAVTTARQWGLEGIVWFQVSKEEDWKMRAGDLE